jgi:glycosyltransferase involved in cell wall biosynthesis
LIVQTQKPTMARVLLLTQVLPYPLDAGPKVRAYYMARHLSEQHELTLVSFVRADDTLECIEHLREFCHAVHTVPIRRSLLRTARAGLKGLLTGLPAVVARDETNEMETLLRRLAAETPFDVIHADQLSMAGYGQIAARAARETGRGPKTLLDEHNAIYLLADRMAATEKRLLPRAVMAREARAFARYEREMCRRYDALLTVTAEDREHLLALFEASERAVLEQKITVVPICVDPDGVQPIPREACGPPTILHLGTMFWPPNITGVLWFAREVLPRVHEEVPEARFVVVGKNPPPEVAGLASDPRIEVAGYAPDPTPYLARADVFAVPLLAGGGMRVKILDAWLWGLPVVSTAIGAEGIETREGENILIAGDAEAFAGAIVRLLRNGALNARLRAAGRAWVEERYGWRRAYRAVDAVYAALSEAPRNVQK